MMISCVFSFRPWLFRPLCRGARGLRRRAITVNANNGCDIEIQLIETGTWAD
jgi:hypothetical protein